MPDDSGENVPVEDHAADTSPKKYRKRTTDLHPLFGGSKTFQDDRRWRRDIPRAGDTEGGC
jgi:hypothetical protein